MTAQQQAEEVELPLVRSTRPPARVTHLATAFDGQSVRGYCGLWFSHPDAVEWDGDPGEVTCSGCVRAFGGRR